MNRVAEVAIEAAIGLAFIAVVVLLAIFVPESRWPDYKWIGAAIVTAFMFGYLLYWQKRLLGNWRFWAFSFAVLAVHSLAWTAALLNLGTWETLPKTPMILAIAIELAVIVTATERIFRHKAEW